MHWLQPMSVKSRQKMLMLLHLLQMWLLQLQRQMRLLR
jgi:hypothetical protein